MNTKKRTKNSRSIGIRLGTLAVAAFLAALPWGNLSEAGGGDGVGGLPLTAANTPAPTLVIEGQHRHVRQAVELATARAIVIEEGNLARATFRGHGMVHLDRTAVVTGEIQAYLDVGPHFAGGLSALMIDGRRAGVQALALGRLDLPLARMEASGLLDLSALHLHNFSPNRDHQRISPSASGSWVRIELAP